MKNFTVTPDPNNHPLLMWETNTEDDIDEYHVYRAITHYEYMPPDQEFVLIAELDHPGNSYVDEDVYMYLPSWNAKIWYTVRAADLASNESLNSNVIRFLGIYHPESEGPTEIAVRVFDPESVNLRVSPNPFNATTMLRFELPESRWVRVEIFDLQGHSSARIIDGLCQSGSYEIPFDGSYLPSGIYVYRLTAGSFQTTGKMVLVK